MVNNELENFARVEFSKVSVFLLKNFGIDIKEERIINYGIKYKAVNKQNKSCKFNLYYNKKKKLSLVFENSQDQNLSNKIEEIFLNKDMLKDSEKELRGVYIDSSYKDFKSIANPSKNRYIDEIYIRLKPYENENIDFRIFGEELLKNINDEKDKRIILSNIDEFNILESIYKKNKI